MKPSKKGKETQQRSEEHGRIKRMEIQHRHRCQTAVKNAGAAAEFNLHHMRAAACARPRWPSQEKCAHRQMLLPRAAWPRDELRLSSTASISRISASVNALLTATAVSIQNAHWIPRSSSMALCRRNRPGWRRMEALVFPRVCLRAWPRYCVDGLASFWVAMLVSRHAALNVGRTAMRLRMLVPNRRGEASWKEPLKRDETRGKTLSTTSASAAQNSADVQIGEVGDLTQYSLLRQRHARHGPERRPRRPGRATSPGALEADTDFVFLEDDRYIALLRPSPLRSTAIPEARLAVLGSSKVSSSLHQHLQCSGSAIPTPLGAALRPYRFSNKASFFIRVSLNLQFCARVISSQTLSLRQTMKRINSVARLITPLQKQGGCEFHADLISRGDARLS